MMSNNIKLIKLQNNNDLIQQIISEVKKLNLNLNLYNIDLFANVPYSTIKPSKIGIFEKENVKYIVNNHNPVNEHSYIAVHTRRNENPFT